MSEPTPTYHAFEISEISDGVFMIDISKEHYVYAIWESKEFKASCYRIKDLIKLIPELLFSEDNVLEASKFVEICKDWKLREALVTTIEERNK